MSIEAYPAGRCIQKAGEILKIEIPWNGEYAVARLIEDNRPILLKDPKEDHDYKTRYSVTYNNPNGSAKEVWVTAINEKDAIAIAMRREDNLWCRLIAKQVQHGEYLIDCFKNPITLRVKCLTN